MDGDKNVHLSSSTNWFRKALQTIFLIRVVVPIWFSWTSSHIDSVLDLASPPDIFQCTGLSCTWDSISTLLHVLINIASVLPLQASPVPHLYALRPYRNSLYSQLVCGRWYFFVSACPSCHCIRPLEHPNPLTPLIDISLNNGLEWIRPHWIFSTEI